MKAARDGRTERRKDGTIARAKDREVERPRERKAERTKERKAERPKERKDEKTKEREDERTKDGKAERAKERETERAKGRKDESAKDRKGEGAAARMRLVPRVAVAALSSPLEVGADRAPGALRGLAEWLRRAGCEVVELGPVGNADEAILAGRRAAELHIDAVALAVASWFEDYLALDLLEECAAPLLLWPLPGMETGALCGTQQATCYLRELGVPFRAVFGEIDEAGAGASALAFVRGAALRSRLRRCRVGLAGSHLNGMTHTAPNEMALKRALGARVVWLDLPRLLESAAAVPEADARRAWQAVRRAAARCEVAETDGLESMRVYVALREAVTRHGLAALTVGCYPHLMGRVCLAESRLADEGIPMACEGDVHGALGQHMLQLLTGQPTHNTDWLDPLDDRRVVFTHCGSGSFSLAERAGDVRLTSVRLMGQGVCALFTARPGAVTLLNITARGDGYQVALLEGEAEPGEMVFPGNPVRVRFDTPVPRLIEWIFEAGLGHHWMIGYGHVAAEVRAWAGLCGPQVRLVEAG